MQVAFIALFGVALTAFSLFVSRASRLFPYIASGAPVPLSGWFGAVGWFAAFLIAFVATGLYLYERERDEGRVARRIGVYDWILNARRRRGVSSDAVARPIRRASDES